MENTDFQDIYNIRYYKDYFSKENYNDIINHITKQDISKIFVNNDYSQLVTVDNHFSQNHILHTHYHFTDINPMLIPNIIEKTSEYNIPISFIDFTTNEMNLLQNILKTGGALFQYTIIAYFIISILRFVIFNFQNNGGRSGLPGSNPMNLLDMFSNSETEFVKPNVSLSSWAGSPEVIEECREVISYLDNKALYQAAGAEMPKGFLFEGPPGTGKTLLAKAIATESNSTFISLSASEFVELYVGMGASRVRDLFETARQNRPSIIFIDEIDAVARQRGSGINMANDEREQTLNQLLYEMDGFNNNDDIIVMAATNRKDVLDQAILRPGRFDRIIRIPLPDKESREKILEYYLSSKKTPKTPPLDISEIAELTDGLSGAQLKNIINEAVIMSVKRNDTILRQEYIFESFEKSVVGLIKKNTSSFHSTRQRVAFHETGHLLLVLQYPEYFDFQKASIRPTYEGAGGYTLFKEKAEIKEGGLYTKDILKKRLIITMGGKAAETIFYGEDHVSLGAYQDLKQANDLAKRMVGNFGMGDKLEVFFNEDISDDSNPFLGRSLSMGEKYSEHTKYIMDKESLELVNEAYKEAKRIILENRKQVIYFADFLQNNTILYNSNITNIFS